MNRFDVVRRGAMLACFAILILCARPEIASAQQTGPRATGVRSEVSGGTITVFYDLVSAGDPGATFVVTLQASLDGGQSYTVKPVSITGDVGANVRAGTGKKIVWDATKDVQVMQLNRFTFNVLVASSAGAGQPARTTPPSAPSGFQEQVFTSGPNGMMVRAGLSLLHDEFSTAKGLLIDFSRDLAVAGNGSLGVVGELSLHKLDGTLLAFGGGARYSVGGLVRIRPYGQVIVGMARFKSDFGDPDFDFSDSGLYVAPGGGVLLDLSPSVGMFVQVDGMFFNLFDEKSKELRFSFGATFLIR